MNKLYKLANDLNISISEQRDKNIYTITFSLNNRIIHKIYGAINLVKDKQLEAYKYLELNKNKILEMKNKSVEDNLLHIYPKLKEIPNIHLLLKDIVEQDKNLSILTNEEILLRLVNLIVFKNTIKTIKLNDLTSFKTIDFINAGKIVTIKINNQNYIALSLGELPRTFKPFINNDSINFEPLNYNPYFYIFELKKFIWGSDCFWQEIKNIEELSKMLDYSLESAVILKILEKYF